MVRPCPCGHTHCLSMASSSHTQMHYNLLDDEYSSSLVDCTLSLGTPSTRKGDTAPRLHRRPPCNLQLCKPYSYFPLASQPTATSDALLTRRCANCDTTSTPLWRNGPKGPKSLCNACGIRFKKEERRATAAAATNSIVQETHVAPRYYQPHNVHQYFLPAPPLGNELSFTVDDVQNQKHQFLSWRLNLTDRPATHLHDFTR